ncbi:hypothetical protein BJV78DRAFT_1115527 [Lactifluus subvellereus]|nr:hypothetical protein BJV78DRAFT_1115527 [Lactifluus subvellereus]
MSFGRPPSISTGFQVTPPNRGSFPLDHYGLNSYQIVTNACKEFMTRYLECLNSNSSASSECRHLNRDYLNCRMQNGLMEKDQWKNLGLADVKGDDESKENKIK